MRLRVLISELSFTTGRSIPAMVVSPGQALSSSRMDRATPLFKISMGTCGTRVVFMD